MKCMYCNHLLDNNAECCQQSFQNKKFVDITQQCFALLLTSSKLYRQWTWWSGAMYVFLSLSRDKFESTLLAPLREVHDLNFHWRWTNPGYLLKSFLLYLERDHIFIIKVHFTHLELDKGPITRTGPGEWTDDRIFVSASSGLIDPHQICA